MNKIFRSIILFTIDAIIFTAIIFGLAGLGVSWGHLPGDIYIQDANGSSSYPIVSGLIIFVIFSIVINLTERFWKKWLARPN